MDERDYVEPRHDYVVTDHEGDSLYIRWVSGCATISIGETIAGRRVHAAVHVPPQQVRDLVRELLRGLE